MCIILDANALSGMFKVPPDNNYQPVVDWLFGKAAQGRLVLGGKLRKELEGNHRAAKAIRSLFQAGRARLIDDGEVGHEEVVVKGLGLCKSNDAHIIALARRSGARLLCSHDQNLHQDFKNKALIANPRGKVYQTAAHARLLRKDSCP